MSEIKNYGNIEDFLTIPEDMPSDDVFEVIDTELKRALGLITVLGAAADKNSALFLNRYHLTAKIWGIEHSLAPN